MITFTTGNLLESDAEALVNTVNTVGVMGKGIALMFKEHFPENFRAYASASKRGEIKVGSIFATERADITGGPRWIINFPTKQHWRNPSREDWVRDGLEDLVRFIKENGIRSIALPPLGAGNGGLDWQRVRPLIEQALEPLDDVQIQVYEPTSRYQNVAKREGKQQLTPARALVVELVRRYTVLGLECSLLEIQKLAYFLERHLQILSLAPVLALKFKANRYGPYAAELPHLLNGLDGSYLHSEKRIADARPMDTISFDPAKKDHVATYLVSEAKEFLPAIEATTILIDGFESPLGMEALATVDWLLHVEGVEATLEGVRKGIAEWPAEPAAAKRKQHIFDDRLLTLALERVTPIAA